MTDTQTRLATEEFVAKMAEMKDYQRARVFRDLASVYCKHCGAEFKSVPRICHCENDE